MPLAVLQGFWVLQRTPRLTCPVGQSGRAGIPDGTRALRVVGVGDSVMAGTGVLDQGHSLTASYARLLHERTGAAVDWRVHGSNGATSARVLHKLAPTAAPADVYLLSVGVNDATRGVATALYARNLHRILLMLSRKSPRAAILFGGLPPLDCFPALPWPLKAMLAARARELQAVAQDVVGRHGQAVCFHFPTSITAEQFASDGFHPAEFACERWASGLLDLWQPPVGELTAVREPGTTVSRSVPRRAATGREAASPRA
jgi:lysophospholipase L1-like esterase